MVRVLTTLFILRKIFYGLELRRDEHFDIKHDARQINVSIVPPTNERFYSMDFIAQMNFVLSNLTISDRSNSSTGGAIHFVNSGWYQPTITIENSIYSKIKSTSSGGTGYFFDAEMVVVKNSSFEITNSSKNGGTLMIENSRNISIEDSSFSNSVALGGSGGTLMIQNSSSIFIEDSNFSRSRAIGGSGGALYLDNATKMDINGSSFKECSSSQFGGSVFMFNASSMGIINSVFEQTESTLHGGGAYLDKADSVEVRKSKFRGGKSSQNGGSMTISNTTHILIEEVETEYSTSTSGGGSIYLFSTISSDAVIKNSVIKSSFSSNGGSLYSSLGTGSQLSIIGNIISNTSSSSSGGAFYLTQQNDFLISNTSITNANSASAGGSIYAFSAKSITVEDSEVIGSKANQGGILYCSSVPEVFLSRNSLSYGYSSTTAGGISITSCNNNISIYQTNFLHIISMTIGGAMHISSSISSEIYFIECNFYNCSAKTSSGMFYLAVDSLKVVFAKICSSGCFVSDSGSSYHGFFIQMKTSTANSILDFNFSTIAHCGSVDRGNTVIYTYHGAHNWRSINMSSNKASQQPFYFQPYATFYGAYFTVFNNTCSAGYNHLVYSPSNSVSSFEITYSNYIKNLGGTHMFLMYSYIAKGIRFSYSIFQEHTQILFYCYMNSVDIKGCMISHSNTIYTTSNAGQFVTEQIFSGITATHTLYHLDTFMCNTPFDLAPLEATPCQTLNSLPASPTECVFDNTSQNEGFLSMSSILHIIMSAITTILLH